MSQIKVAILGASGYTGSELIRFLINHPRVEIAHLTAQRHAGRLISDVFPHLNGRLDLELHPLKITLIPKDIDLVFAALPHGSSAAVIKKLYKRDIKIVDLGADFRISHKKYKKWYGVHECPELIKNSVYGIPELFRDDILNAKIVANPGCYPTGAILALAPLLKNKVVREKSIIIDSKSGVTGAGRSPSQDLHYSEVNEGVKAYKVGVHRHMPEIEEVLSNFSGLDVSINFTPHLVPMDRGILSTIYVDLKKSSNISKLLKIYKDFYKDSLFVRMCPVGKYSSTSDVKGSNYCDIGIKIHRDKNSATVVSAIDNLVKGASGQAVQNMNIMMGFPESMGIDNSPVFP